MRLVVDHLYNLEKMQRVVPKEKRAEKISVLEQALAYYYGTLNGNERLWVNGRMVFAVSKDGLYFDSNDQRRDSVLINNYIEEMK